MLALINPQFQVDFVEVAPGDMIELGSFSMRVFAVDHGIGACGYVFEEHERPGSLTEEKQKSLD